MSKFLEPRSYVREFNAASMAEAIKLADEVLRIDGVTVAVWKNYADIMPAEFHTWVKEMVEDMNEHNNQTLDQWCKKNISEKDQSNLSKLICFWGNGILSDFFVNGEIRKHFSSVVTLIHQDGSLSVNDDKNSRLPFKGNPIRALYNVEGRPTEFMLDEHGTDIYPLPKGSLGFFKYKLLYSGGCSEAAWHRGVDENIPRTFMAMTLRARSPF